MRMEHAMHMTRQDTKRLSLRLPMELWQVLKEEAQQAHRSLTSEILHRLVESLTDDEDPRPTGTLSFS